MHRSAKSAKNNKWGSQTENCDQDVEKYKLIADKTQTTNDLLFVVSCLKNHFVFYNISDHDLENIAKSMFYCEVSEE